VTGRLDRLAVEQALREAGGSLPLLRLRQAARRRMCDRTDRANARFDRALVALLAAGRLGAHPAPDGAVITLVTTEVYS
jgi:hypothetical protein